MHKLLHPLNKDISQQFIYFFPIKLHFTGRSRDRNPQPGICAKKDCNEAYSPVITLIIAVSFHFKSDNPAFATLASMLRGEKSVLAWNHMKIRCQRKSGVAERSDSILHLLKERKGAQQYFLYRMMTEKHQQQRMRRKINFKKFDFQTWFQNFTGTPHSLVELGWLRPGKQNFMQHPIKNPYQNRYTSPECSTFDSRMPCVQTSTLRMSNRDSTMNKKRREKIWKEDRKCTCKHHEPRNRQESRRPS